MAHIIPIQHLGVYRSAEEVSRDQSFGSWNARTGGASVTGWFCDPNSWHCHGIVPLKCGKKEAIVTNTSYYISGIKKNISFPSETWKIIWSKAVPRNDQNWFKTLVGIGIFWTHPGFRTIFLP